MIKIVIVVIKTVVLICYVINEYINIIKFIVVFYII
jgi:hypothetical protein